MALIDLFYNANNKTRFSVGNMKTFNITDDLVIVPDVHDKISKVQLLLDRHHGSKFIFLGDFFDSYEQKSAYATACFVKQKLLNDENITCLFGNHDVPYHYIFVPEYLCSGNTQSKYNEINAILSKDDWDKFDTHVWILSENGNNPWLLSHAGLTKELLSPQLSDVDSILAEIDHNAEQALKNLKLGIPHPYFSAGYDRGGGMLHGGLNWCDFTSFTPVPYIDQICGHTRNPKEGVRMKKNKRKTSKNYCIDTDLNHYAIFKNGELEIKEV